MIRQSQVGLKLWIYEAMLQAIEANPASITQSKFDISWFSVVCHRVELGKSIQSYSIVPHVTKILQNFWLMLVYYQIVGRLDSLWCNIKDSIWKRINGEIWCIDIYVWFYWNYCFCLWFCMFIFFGLYQNQVPLYFCNIPKVFTIIL